MLRTALLLCLVAACLSLRIERVRMGVGQSGMPTDYQYEVNLRDHFIDVRNGATATWGPPKEPPYSLPFSARVLYMYWNPVASPFSTDVDTEMDNQNTLFITFDHAPGTGVNYRVRFESPNMEVNPESCFGGHCRCQPGNFRVKDYDESDGDTVNTAFAVDESTVQVLNGDIHITDTYFEHAPFANQNPYLRTYRRLCVAATNWGASVPNEAGVLTNDYYFDTNIFVAVTHGCVDGLTDPDADAVDPDFLARCNFATDTGRAQGVLMIQGTGKASPATNDQGFLGDFYLPNSGVFVAGITATAGVADGETAQMFNDRFRRTTCCGSHGNLAAAAGTVFSLGVCIDSTKADCCGKRPYNPYDERCCDRRDSTVRYLDSPCPCYTNNVENGINVDCNLRGENVFVANDHSGFLQGATSDYSCATMSKWGSEISSVGQNSNCYHNGGAVQGDPWVACDDGNLYNPGTHQCCVINGVQSINVPCPCGTNADCPGDEACCFQVWPPGLPRGEGARQCSKYANWPRFTNGTISDTPEDELESFAAAWQAQRCPGSCFSPHYEICCNGRVCNRNFDKCCNDTCCNKYTSSCIEGRRPGATGSRYNPKDWHVWFETCSSIEHFSGRRAWFVFILPIMLLFGTLLSLAFVAVLARRATEHIFELTERAMVFCAVVATLLSCVYFFSPIYKNGVAIAFVCMGAILIAVARKRGPSFFLMFVMVFLILYVIDPIGGNIYLSVTSAIPIFGAPKMSSLFEASQQIWRTNNLCTEYYQFFEFDNAARDFERFDNPEKLTFGYCSRAWVTTLMIVAAVLYVLLLVLLLLSILSYVKKLGMKPVEPIELEVAYDAPPPMPMGIAPMPMGVAPW